MKTFKQKSLYAALAGVTALGVTGAAQAVNVNPDGLGQVLIYPYYTVRDKVAGSPFSTLLTVVNSTASAKAVKVRFLEGKNSQEVLDFNLFLSHKDVWTAAVLATDAAAGVGSFDKSCTVPPVVSTADSPVIHEFVNFQYEGDAVGDDDLDRTREGYAEIIEMGTIIGGSATEKAVTHKAGVPSCAGIDDDASVIADLTAPSGGLFGDLTLINVNAGEDYTADAVALDNFRNTGRYDSPGNILPTLNDVSPRTSVVVNNNTIIQSDFSNNSLYSAIDTISALFMHDHIYNTFILDTGTHSGTDWVLTAPTKRYYFDPATGIANGGQTIFQRNLDENGACDDIAITVYDREEASATPQINFSPAPHGKVNSLCWESTVLTFNSSHVLGSSNQANVTGVTYQNGWADLAFPVSISSGGTSGFGYHYLASFGDTTTLTINGIQLDDQTATYLGLPLIGFALESYANGTIPGADGGTVLSNYGGNFVHKGTRSIIIPLIAP